MITFRTVMVRSAVLLLVGTVAGCGDSVYPVEGVVFLDGKPLEKCAVTFQPEAGGPIGFGTTDENGRFRLVTAAGNGVRAGDYQVTLSKITGSVPDIMPPWVGPGAPDPTPAMVAAWKQNREEARKDEREWVPTKYRFTTTTPLRSTVPVEEDVRLELISTEADP